MKKNRKSKFQLKTNEIDIFNQNPKSKDVNFNNKILGFREFPGLQQDISFYNF